MNTPFARLLADLRRRYPGPSPAPAAGNEHGPGPEGGPPQSGKLKEQVGKLPKEVGALLIAIGVAGLLLPGPVGSPFLVAGGLVLWPDGFGRVEGWFGRKFPRMHREGVAQIGRFLGDLEHRYPGSIR